MKRILILLGIKEPVYSKKIVFEYLFNGGVIMTFYNYLIKPKYPAITNYPCVTSQ